MGSDQFPMLPARPAFRARTQWWWNGTPLHDLPLPTIRERVLVQDKDPMILSGAAEDLFDIPRTGRVDVTSALSYASALDVVDARARELLEPVG